LTAYDLETFHHRGANYPDALLLDAVLGRYLTLVEGRAELSAPTDNGQDRNPNLRRRRRALRQACLLRRHYEALPVPDAPTSPGENARVLPAPHVRVPEEQLTNVLRRRKRLYQGDQLVNKIGPAARHVLAQSIEDLAIAAEAQEMGKAIFIDRPFGWFKAPGEADTTPLLAHLAFSPAIARRRFHELMKLAVEVGIDTAAPELVARFEANLQAPGLPIERVAEPGRPTVSLSDARRVSTDFVVQRTLPTSWAEAMDWDVSGVRARFPELAESLQDWLAPQHETGAGQVLTALASPAPGILAILDREYRTRLEVAWDLSEGIRRSGNREYPAAGLRLLRYCEVGPGGRLIEHDWTAQNIRVPWPRKTAETAAL
jgi:hypothetical protein